MENLDHYLAAGRIHAEVRAEVQERLTPGTRLLEIADFIERRIKEKGGGLAFPVNTSLNEVAAHYVAQRDDQTVIAEGDLLKVDIGVQVEGCVADGAFTYCSEKSDLAAAAERAIAEAVKVIRPGARVGDISQAIEDTVRSAGFGLIVNLTGHGVDEYQFHAPPTIPNTATGSRVLLEEGQVIALEPFVAERNGYVKESTPIEIYRLLLERPVRLAEARQIQQLAAGWNGFPFAKRWLPFSPIKVSMALRQLDTVNAIESYPPLKEQSGMRVAQAEHTVVVLDKPVVTTQAVT
ncbi:MAG: type II methionyl aminopeptidase [Candidatus Aenigmarchaeota archaeon]|nr:type II methionyl aminopeptidase [Candidatus Aenigmarchaeota archaeon]